MKSILSVQDISCLGRCSQTVALPVLSAMGIRCGVLPTAVLSTHTAFPSPYCRSLTEDVAPILAHWKSIGAEFDAVLVGYLADSAQCAQVQELLETQTGLKILDPAMGDHGKLYSGLKEDHIPAMKELCPRADILVPNVTEAALLTGMEYRERSDEGYYRELARVLVGELGLRGVVITGVSLAPGQTGFLSYCHRHKEFYQVEKQDKTLHGTGDLFSAVLAGGLLKGKELFEAAKDAAYFVEKAIAATEKVTPYGVEFEKVLKELV